MIEKTVNRRQFTEQIGSLFGHEENQVCTTKMQFQHGPPTRSRCVRVWYLEPFDRPEHWILKAALIDKDDGLN